MNRSVPARSEVPEQYTWDLAAIFPSLEAWHEAFARIEQRIPDLQRFEGHLGDSPQTLAEWFALNEQVQTDLFKVAAYARSQHNVETGNQEATARNNQATSLVARVSAAVAFAEPEILQIGWATLQDWMQQNSELAIFRHYFESLERRRSHIRSEEVEELLAMARDPFATSTQTHATLVDTDLRFAPAITSGGEEVAVAQGNLNALLTDTDRTLRRTAWESYADAHLAVKNTLANALAAGVKQDVFYMRARRYSSSLEAALDPQNIPAEVFHTLLETFQRNLPIWHRYWRIRREGLGYDELHEWDIKAPLTTTPPHVPYEQAVEWIVEGMRPLGEEYVTVLQRGATAERWVDIYPNQGKRSGAYSMGVYGAHPFILMSYNDDLFSMSTLAHELGHSMHSFFTHRHQPWIYARYGMFVAEVASNFNQAMVRAHMLRTHQDPDFQIAIIEEAMSNFHRYLFIMPTLARFELEIHQRVERGQPLTASNLIELMASLFQEGYGDEVVMNEERTGITWAEFPVHMYANFYVFQYATGIAAAHALAYGILEQGQEAANRYLSFLQAGNSVDPLDALKMAGVDMTSPASIQRGFDIMGDLVNRLATLLPQRSTARA